MDFGFWITSTKLHSREPLQITSLSNQVHTNSTAHFTDRVCFNPTAVLWGDCIQAHSWDSFSWSWGVTAVMKCAALPNTLANRTRKGAPLSPNFSFFFLPHLNDIPHLFHLPHFTHSIPVVLKMWPLGWQHLYHPGNCYRFLGPQSRPTESGTQSGAQQFGGNGPSKWLWCSLEIENHCLSYSVKINLPPNQFSRWFQLISSSTEWSICQMETWKLKRWQLAKLNKWVGPPHSKKGPH